MKVKRSLLMLCLATGLSLGGLYGCGGREKTSDSNNSTTTTSEETASNGNAGANDAEIQQIQQKLDEIKAANQEVYQFLDSIKRNPDNGIVDKPVNYEEAKQKVDTLATAYNEFNTILSDEIKSKINFAQIKPHIDEINKILDSESPKRAILSNLAIGYPKDINKDGKKVIQEYGQVQTALSQLDIDGQPIYSGEVDSKDGSGQRIAVKKFLLYKIYKPIEELTKVTITVKSSEGGNGGGGNIEGENGGNSGGENNSNDSTSDNGGIWPLLNTLVLLGAAGTCAFVNYKVNKLNTNNKEDNAFLIKLEPEEDQQTPEQREAKQEINTKLKKIQDSLQNIENILIDDSSSEVNGESNVNKCLKFFRKFVTQEKENPSTPLNDEQYNELIKFIKDVRLLLDENYIAMLRYNNHGRYEQAIQTTIQTIQENIDKHIEGLENGNQGNNTIDQNEIKQAVDNSLTTVKPKLDSILEKLQSVSSHNLQNTTQASNNNLTEQEIEKYKKKITELTEERNKYKGELQEEWSKYARELQVKNDEITELKTGEIGKIRQERDEWFKKYEKVYKDYENAYQYYEKYQTLEIEKDNITTEFNQVRQQLQQQIDEKDREMQEKDQQIQQKDNEINQLKGDVERLTAVARKEAPQNNQLTSQWQALVNLYMQDPENIKNNATDEVMENDDNLLERRSNANKPVIFKNNRSDQGYYIISSGNDYLLFPKQHGIAPSQKYTATAVFEGYKSGSTKKFTSIVPAQVKSVSNGWELKNKGRLEYS